MFFRPFLPLDYSGMQVISPGPVYLLFIFLVAVQSLDLGDGELGQTDVCHSKDDCRTDFSEAFSRKIVNDPL